MIAAELKSAVEKLSSGAVVIRDDTGPSPAIIVVTRVAGETDHVYLIPVPAGLEDELGELVYEGVVKEIQRRHET